METRNRGFGVIPMRLDLHNRASETPKPLDTGEINALHQAMQDLAASMEGWGNIDLDQLHKARNAFLANDRSKGCIDDLYNAARNLKSLGVSYGFPIVSLIAGALCSAILNVGENRTLPADVVNAHVDALWTVVNLNLYDPQSGPAVDLMRSLLTVVKDQSG